MGNTSSTADDNVPKEIFVEQINKEIVESSTDALVVFVDTSWNQDDEIIKVLAAIGKNKFVSEWDKLKDTKANNCQVGDVFRVPSGGIQCRHLLFAVWREGDAKDTTDVQFNFIVQNMLERAKGLDDKVCNIAIPMGDGMDIETHVKIMNNVFLWLMGLSSDTTTHIHFLASNLPVKEVLEYTLQNFKEFAQKKLEDTTNDESEDSGDATPQTLAGVDMTEPSEEDLNGYDDDNDDKTRWNEYPNNTQREHLLRMSSESSCEEIIPFRKNVDRFPEKESIWKYYAGTHDDFENIKRTKRPKSVLFDEVAAEYSMEGRPVQRTLSQSSVDEVMLDFTNYPSKRKIRRPRKPKPKSKTSEVPPSQSPPPTEAFFCSICQSKKHETWKRVLEKCGHEFCSECIKKHFEEKPSCPNCNTFYGKPLGNQPWGVMSCRTVNQYLPGFPGTDTIIIDYDIPDGIQTERHPNPGVKFKGAHRTAYLPDNEQGRLIHRMLKKAFDQQLVFTVGKSATSGRDNVVTWNDIHHKTRADGGPERYGYPDPEYLDRVYEQLKKSGITDDD
ncbi:deltex [Mytilus galloprovincialis]|uniref:E3 ubiquitin-protein ligase n=1 Tax=Mytilus galloprovincialis TaxID=29158 RepID=A0A8B6G4D2_MYTGA|nr:deltex [Mytilus galloprovincialis]